MSPGRGIPKVINLSLAGFYSGANFYQFFVLPLWLLPASAAWAWTLVPLALLTNPFWSLIHEAIHDLLHPDRRLNALWGRWLAILFGAPFRVLRLSHLLHHKLNRLPVEGTEFYDGNRGSKAAAAPSYYCQILFGLYVVELASPLVFFLPRGWLERFQRNHLPRGSVSSMLMQNWLGSDALREIRRDGFLALSWLTLSFCAYGQHWPILLGLIGARAFLISFLDNIYHYETPAGDVFYAKNLRLSRPLAKLLLHFNLHGIHHLNPAIAWIDLPQALKAQNGELQGGYFAAAWRQLRGPIALQDLAREGRTRGGR